MISALNHGRVFARWAAGLSLAVALASSPAVCQAQVQSAFYQPNPAQSGQVANTANFLRSSGGTWMNAHGESVVVPANYCGPGGCGAGMDCGPGMGCSPGGCNICGGGGCPCCCAAGCGPYPPGGPFGDCDPYGRSAMDPSVDVYGMPNVGVDQCGPHYFDFSAEFLFWQKERSGDPRVDFVKEGINGPTVIGTNNVDFEEEPGLRLIGRYDLGALTFVEIGYSGLFEWGNAAQVNDANGVFFTPFSNFGIGFDTNGDGVPDLAVGGVGLDSTEAATFARMEYLSELHNGEITFRRYWVGYNPRVTGTFLAGFRYTRLSEELNFNTQAIGNAQFATQTENDLVGFQVGGDVSVCVRQGIRIGGTGKAGVYNNRTESAANITSTDLPGPLFEVVKADHVSFIGEGNLSIVCDVLPSVSVRAGYDVLFINTVALASNNFNFDPAPFLGGNRTPVLIEESSALYHGFNAGLEYVW
ncbi:MAG: hypothetical protein ACR2NU_12375 [Aeoliella sp.]